MALGDPYASTAELSAIFRIGDSDDDIELDNAVKAASRWVTRWCGRDFNRAGAASTRTFRPTGRTETYVDDIATTTGLVVAVDTGDDGTYETTWVVDTDYVVTPLNGTYGGFTGWPYTGIRRVSGLYWPTLSDRAALSVTAEWGWPAVPADIKQATLIMAARLYKRRDSPEGVLGGLGDFGPVRVGSRLDPDVEMLLDPYRLTPLAVA